VRTHTGLPPNYRTVIDRREYENTDQKVPNDHPRFTNTKRERQVGKDIRISETPHRTSPKIPKKTLSCTRLHGVSSELITSERTPKKGRGK
jgi:hypothetical protein